MIPRGCRPRPDAMAHQSADHPDHYMSTWADQWIGCWSLAEAVGRDVHVPSWNVWIGATKFGFCLVDVANHRNQDRSNHLMMVLASLCGVRHFVAPANLFRNFLFQRDGSIQLPYIGI